MEWKVLKEIEHKLYLVNEIIIEYHNFEELPQTLGDILQLFNKNGFKYLIGSIPGLEIPLPFRLYKNYKYFNLIYAKNLNR